MKKVVRIGGGSGGFTLLRALKELPLEITAVFTMFDNGGSTGILRDEFGVLPPGDVRRGLLALSDGPQADILRKLFAYRFENEKSSLHDHSFGNLFLLALTSLYGSETEAIKKASELLNLKGRVLPVSIDQSHVHAVLGDGTEIVGETNIDIPKHNGDIPIERIFLDPPAQIYPETADAIHEADLVVIGPGDIYSSIVPALLVGGMKEALAESAAKKVVVGNLMTKWGETHGFVLSDMVRVLSEASGISKFDYVLANIEPFADSVRATYAEAKQFPLVCDEKVSDFAHHVITGNYVSGTDVARHDCDELARVLSTLA